ncbi:MAG: hypothetical protein Q8P12_08215, partial [bacterium]|nr:hypothetical protein [bacterium]
MEHRQKRLTKIGFLAIFLVAFVALFGFAADASAALCTSSTHTGNPVWKAVDFTCDVFYEDPGGAGLAECEYRFYNIDTGVYVPSSGWWTASGTCSGDSATLQASVFVGTIQDCRNNGLDKCRLEWRAEDNAHNESQGTVTHFDIDYFPPSGGFISYTNGFIIQTSVSLTVNDGTDPHSGVNTATRTTQRRSATLSSGVCGSYGSFATFSPTGMYPDFTDSTLASATCYQYRYLVSDNAGNQATYTSANEVKVDAIKPELDAFSADRTFLNIVNPTVTFSWTIEDFGGSGLKQIELWRKAPGGGWLPHDTDTFPSGQGPVSGQFQDTPTANGTYEYGVHVLDEAGNQCDEGGTGGGGPGGCAGTYGAAGTKFVEVEKTAPTGSIIINGGAPYTTSTSVILSLTCNDDGVACDASDTMNISGDCTFSGAYSSSLGCTLTSGDGLKTVSVRYTDGAGNQSSMYSDTITLDTTPPNTTITDAPPDPSFVDTASFSFTSTESGTFQCQLDGGGYSSCTSPKNYSGLSQATHTFLVKAIDLAGNEDPTPASHTWQVILNLAPSISSVNDSPDPIGVGSQITFQVFWSDPDGDSTRIHICKTDSISGQTCSGGSWCDTASFSSSSPTSCNYTTLGGDAGQKSYWAFACDNGSPNLCSPSQSGTFLVDGTAPSISSFTASPAPPAWISNGAPNATVDWSVSDTGG